MSDLRDIFGQDFDVNQHEPLDEFSLLPPGKYIVQILNAELRMTKAQNGHYIYLDMVIMDGDSKGQHVFDRINVDNPSEKCVAIGKRTLSSLARALGITKLTDTGQLVNGVVIAHVRVKNDNNEVRNYSSVQDQPATTPSMSAAAKSVDDDTLPWME